MADENTGAFSANETKIIMAVMQNLTADIQFDVEKVASQLGYKDTASFRARWNTIKRNKLTGTAASGGGTAYNCPAGKLIKSAGAKRSKSTPTSAPESVEEVAKEPDSDGEQDLDALKIKGMATYTGKLESPDVDSEAEDVSGYIKGKGQGKRKAVAAFGGDSED